MASVFLSYDRDDTTRARHFAQALEKAGHRVWWDLHIRSGAQFAKAIEEALSAADVVVVLWSRDSVESPWVRDEAAAGRDTGRLVPVTIDGIEPPLGFRQFQTINLSRWKGRGAPAELRALLADIEAIPAADPAAAVTMPAAAAKRPVGPRHYLLPLVAALVLVLGGGLYWAFAGNGARSTTVAVAASDSSTQPLARDMLINLGNLPSVQTGSVRLVGETDQQRPDLIFQAESAATNGGANLVLMRGEDRSILWSKEFGQEQVTPGDLKMQMTYTAGRVLGCALEGLEPGEKALGAQTLKHYLTGCSQYAEANDETRASVIPVFEGVVNEVPRFEAGWARLLLAESDAVAEDGTRNRSNLRRYIVQARKLDPEMPEAVLAEVTLLPTRAFGEALRLLDHAKEKHPGNGQVLGYRSVALSAVGRMTEAIEDAKEAARLDPTSPDALNNYVLALAYSGRVDAARAELQRAERLWSGTGRLQELQKAFQLRFGDPKEMVNSGRFKESNPRMQMYFRTRADPTPANVDRFMAFLRGLYSRRGLTASDIAGHSQADGELHREDDLYELIYRLPPGEDLRQLAGLLFRPSLRKFREDPRFMTVTKRVGLLDYWITSGKWPDFCFDPGLPYDCRKEAAKLQ